MPITYGALRVTLLPEPEVETVLPDVTIDYAAQEAMRLDRLAPGWHDKINTNSLDLECIYNCVLGQLSGSWCAMFSQMGKDARENGEAFDSDVYADQAYRKDWLREINKRRNA